ncbi:MAG TPA: hypothetical protein DGR97_03660 [Gammaproteobacteria bacterium]|nr:hypothetical protein [Gammaproteobacteria bacterium]
MADSRQNSNFIAITIPLFVVIMLSFAFYSNSQADQYDPKLDNLFVLLRDANNKITASQMERKIWAIWQQAPNDTAFQIMRRAQAAMNKRDFKSSIRLLDKLVTQAPNFAEAWNQRAIALYLVADYDASLRDIDQTLALEPRHFGAMAGRGQVYLRLNEHKLALQAFQAALEWNPWMENVQSYVFRIRKHIRSLPKPI